MALTIKTAIADHVAILELQGALTLGPSLILLRQAAREALAAANVQGLILDVGAMTSVDSSGLGELTIVYSASNRHNCTMLLTGVNANLQKMLEMTHLDGVLASAADVDAAKKQLRLRKKV